jgi:putative N-acetylmannosamine-6-phosphate epimerase/predicted NBD/HSP70 family sugar kinase
MLSDIKNLLAQCPLVVSVQATDGAAVDVPEILLQMAKCSTDEGVKILRLQGADNIHHIKSHLKVPVIGLVKKAYPPSEIYISPTKSEVQTLIDLGCEIIALDATARPRPNQEKLADLVSMIHQSGRLAMADCDCPDTIQYAVESGCDVIGTTLAGYTNERAATVGPDFELVRHAVKCGKPVIAEGRYARRSQVEAALRIGATAVVVGGAINDPVKQTKALMPTPCAGKIGAVDIGGTWLRFGIFERGNLAHVEKIARPETREARTEWIRQQISAHGIEHLGVGTGGTVDPTSGEVWEAKPIIPGHQGSIFHSTIFGIPVVALNDGLATAWGHANHANFAGKNVATLALGTGVGAGFVIDGKLQMGHRGAYPRLNDISTPTGKTVEELLGGAGLSPYPSQDQMDDACLALQTVVRTVKELVYPDVIVVCGGVGLSDWLRPLVTELGCETSPYGADAGLWGSRWLVTLQP